MARQNIAKTAASLVALFLFATALMSCRPMYGTTSMGSNASFELASIEINLIPGRVGQKIRNELIFMFTGGNHPAPPKYKLEIIYRESVKGVLYKRTDDSSGKIYSIDATYTLKDITGKKELTKGHSHARSAFDKQKSTFSNIRAEQDAENRAAKEIAKDINTRIGSYIALNQ